jgi:predicted nuclease of predicted toxin-antitoxin system
MSAQRFLVSTALLVWYFASASSSTTLDVPGTYATNQSAINAASTNDTILVSPDTYEETITINNKSVVLLSTGDASNTIIDTKKNGNT